MSVSYTFENKFYLKFVFCVQYLILSGHFLFLWKPLCEAPVQFKGPSVLLPLVLNFDLLVLMAAFHNGMPPEFTLIVRSKSFE
jgi:hypothetical protein